MLTKTSNLRVVDPNSKEQWRSFLDCGQRIRKRNNPEGVAFWKDTNNVRYILNPKKVKAYRFFMLSENGLEGRMAAIIKKGESSAIVGWFECDNDQKLCNRLFDQVINWCKKHQVEKIIGPVNGSTWYTYRFNLTDSRPLFNGEPFQPLYYPDFWQKEGFVVSKQYVSNHVQVTDNNKVSFGEASEYLQKKALTLKKLSPSVYNENKTALHHFLVKAFSKNPLYSSIDIEEFSSLYDAFPAKILEEFAYIILDKKNIPVGLCLSYPTASFSSGQASIVTDNSPCKPKLVIKTIAIHNDWKNQNIGSLMVKLINGIAQKYKLNEVIHALIHCQNQSLDISKRKFDTNTLRRYALFEKQL